MSEFKRATTILDGYTKIEKRRDPILGEVTVHENKNAGTTILSVEKMITDKETLMREIENKKRRILDKNEYILSLYDYSVDTITSLCATSFTLKLYYEYAQKTLQNEIVDRKRTDIKGSFKMEELTHLLYHQVLAHSFLEERGMAHGDICPQNIGITKKKEYKIAFRPNDQIGPERSQFDKMMRKDPLFVSPILYQNIKRRSFDKGNHNAHKSDVYSLGLTLLHAGLMRPIDQIYGDTEISREVVDDYLRQFEEKYVDNPLLYTTVSHLLVYDEKERKNFIEIRNLLPPYKEIADYLDKLERGLIQDTDAFDDTSSLNDSLKNAYNFDDKNKQYVHPTIASQNNFDNYPQGYYQNYQANPQTHQPDYSNYQQNYQGYQEGEYLPPSAYPQKTELQTPPINSYSEAEYYQPQGYQYTNPNAHYMPNTESQYISTQHTQDYLPLMGTTSTAFAPPAEYIKSSYATPNTFAQTPNYVQPSYNQYAAPAPAPYAAPSVSYSQPSAFGQNHFGGEGVTKVIVSDDNFFNF